VDALAVVDGAGLAVVADEVDGVVEAAAVVGVVAGDVDVDVAAAEAAACVDGLDTELLPAAAPAPTQAVSVASAPRLPAATITRARWAGCGRRLR
jgi:hypothetical protein